MNVAARRILSRASLGLVAILLLAVLGALGLRECRQWHIAAAFRIVDSTGIESLERVTLNGARQWILIRGHDTGNPVLLFLHGGPGIPEMAVARRFGAELERHFTVVHWDQRASGKSRRESFNDADLTIRTYLRDTLALVELLRERFKQKKIYLIGHSWGTVLGTLAARDHASLFHAYVGMGQVVNIQQGERISLEYAIDRARDEGNQLALSELEELKPPYRDAVEQLSVQRKWLYRYGGGVRNIEYLEVALDFISSPEYSLLDYVAMAQGMIAVYPRMWPELSDIDLMRDAPRLDVPVFFFVGRHDFNTPSVLVEQYFDRLEAPRKELVWFESSAHMMNLSDPERFQQVMIERVLKQRQPSAR